MNLTVSCDRCKCTLEHVCSPDLRRAVIDLYKMTLDGNYREILEKSDHYQPDAEVMPFYSEAFLYPFLGKDNARSVLGTVSYLVKMAGLDPHELEEVAWAELVQAKVQLKHDKAVDLLVLTLRGAGGMKETKKKKNGVHLLLGRGGAKDVIGLSIEKASSIKYDALPDVPWLTDAFAIWQHNGWNETAAR